MADEPSIDEILASLDRLLNESEGRNDEPADPSHQAPSEQPAPEAMAEPLAEPIEAPVEAPVEEIAEEGGEAGVDEAAEAPEPSFFAALDHAVSEPYNDAEGDEHTHGGDAHKASEVLARALATAEAEHGAKAEPGAKRIVLTDAMLVKDVQQSLPLDMGEPERAEAAEPTAEPTVKAPVSPVPAWDERDVQALVDQVTDDVCSAMSEQLPEMIRNALAQRLSAFIDARVRRQDSGPEE